MHLLGKASQNPEVPLQKRLPGTESRDFSEQDDASSPTPQVAAPSTTTPQAVTTAKTSPNPMQI
jgi:hypothetical protein